MSNTPTLAEYITFLRNDVGISTTVLPDNSFWIGASYNLAVDLVNSLLSLVPNADNTYMSIYVLAVYNLATDRLMYIAQDLPGAQPVPGSNPPQPYFTYWRGQMKLNSFTSGIIKATSDEGTSVALEVPTWASNMSMLDLQTVKTPWGRTYMALAQQYGTTDWGLT